MTLVAVAAILGACCVDRRLVPDLPRFTDRFAERPARGGIIGCI